MRHDDVDEFKGDLLLRLANGVDELTETVSALRLELNRRPTGASVAARRRGSVAGLLLFGVLVVMGHDAHVETCSPGAQAERVIGTVVDENQLDINRRQLQRVVEGSQPTAFCDLTFPLHHHGLDGVGEYEPVVGDLTRWNLAGLGMYAAVAVGVWLWRRGPATRDSNPPAS